MPDTEIQSGVSAAAAAGGALHHLPETRGEFLTGGRGRSSQIHGRVVPEARGRGGMALLGARDELVPPDGRV